MEKHAFLKTHVKLPMKEKEGLERAYEVEQACSVKSENSLQELVALLEAERWMHSGKMNELKQHVKHKFSKLKKRRVPVDAAYKASLVLYALTYQHYSMQLWELSMMIAEYNIKLHIYQAYFLFRPTNNNVTS